MPLLRLALHPQIKPFPLSPLGARGTRCSWSVFIEDLSDGLCTKQNRATPPTPWVTASWLEHAQRVRTPGSGPFLPEVIHSHVSYMPRLPRWENCSRFCSHFWASEHLGDCMWSRTSAVGSADSIAIIKQLNFCVLGRRRWNGFGLINNLNLAFILLKGSNHWGERASLWASGCGLE